LLELDKLEAKRKLIILDTCFSHLMTKNIPDMKTGIEILTSSSKFARENGFYKFEEKQQNLFAETLYKLMVGELPSSLFSSEKLMFVDICHSIINVFYDFNYQIFQDPHYYFHKVSSIDDGYLYLSNPRLKSKFGVHHHSLLNFKRDFSQTKRDFVLQKVESLRKLEKLPVIETNGKYDYLYKDNELGLLLWHFLLDQYLAYYDRNIKEFFLGGFAEKYTQYIDDQVKEFLKGYPFKKE
jgi:hypothetical protein